MELKLFKALWGMQGALEEQFQRIASSGYSGIEAPMIWIEDRKKFKHLLSKYRMEFIAQVISFGDANEVQKHIETFSEQLNQATELEPIQINAHSGRDNMEFSDQCRFFEKVLLKEQQIGIAIGHETHRSRAMFTPWSTSKLLRQFPELKITADISHWVCVCESLLEDQENHLAEVIKRAIHIHGRVGFAQGPQVPHPAAPEYANELKFHESVWMRIYQHQQKLGRPFVTFNPEFGPPGYMHTIPFTNQPVTDLWEVCTWMSERFLTLVRNQ